MDIEETKTVSPEENAFLGFNRSSMSREFLPVSKHSRTTFFFFLLLLQFRTRNTL